MKTEVTNWDGLVISYGEGIPHYPYIVRDALAKLASKDYGAMLLKGIASKPKLDMKWPHKIVIEKLGPDIYSQTKKGMKHENPVNAIARTVANNVAASKDSSLGTFSTVRWNPNYIESRSKGMVEYKPNFIILGHELIHAYHNLCGTRKEDYDDEENATIGLGIYANSTEVTENKLRQEHGLGPRE